MNLSKQKTQFVLEYLIDKHSPPKAIVKPVIMAIRASMPIVMNIQPINHTARREPLSKLNSIDFFSLHNLLYNT